MDNNWNSEALVITDVEVRSGRRESNPEHYSFLTDILMLL